MKSSEQTGASHVDGNNMGLVGRGGPWIQGKKGKNKGIIDDQMNMEKAGVGNSENTQDLASGNVMEKMGTPGSNKGTGGFTFNFRDSMDCFPTWTCNKIGQILGNIRSLMRCWSLRMHREVWMKSSNGPRKTF